MPTHPLSRRGRASATTKRRRRADGEKSRRAILQAAAEMASVEGLEGLSLGALAARLGISKSGLFAHFGSKEELEIATIEAAGQVFADDILRPGFAAPPGVRRLVALGEAFLSHVERRVFPGGCFFAAAAAELDSRSGPVRERIAAFQREWMGTLERQAAEARAAGELDRSADPRQIAFELHAILLGADTKSILTDDPAVLDLARQVIRQRLGLDHAGES